MEDYENPGDIYEGLVSFEVDFPGVDPNIFNEITGREIILAESLLTPGLQTSIKLQSYTHTLATLKNFDIFKSAQIKIKLTKPLLARAKYPDTMEIDQVVYRLGGRSSTNPNTTDNRKLLGRTVEELIFHACDQTLLNDAASLVSKSWKCTTPTAIVEEVLRGCAGVRRLEPEKSCCPRDYIAENIHPFQVVTQQANAALAGDNDPSFIHYMTYENLGTHHFKSLYSLTKGTNIMKKPLEYSNAGGSYTDVHGIMNYVFPCDFDVLSDILNGIGPNGEKINSVALANPANKVFSLLGNQDRSGCGIGGGVHKIVKSNQGSAKNENSCPDYAAQYTQLRQARMALLEKDKIALRMVVPWNPIYHAGKVVTVHIKNIDDITGKTYNYGSGDYLIVSLVHNVKEGGYSTTTLDCVSTTVGRGEV